MKELKLTNYHLPVIVDDEDYERLLKYSWSVNNNRASVRRIYRGTNGTMLVVNIAVALANEVMQNFTNIYDHIDRNYLNNQKSNLRVATQQQNMFNVSKRKGASSKYKGASYIKRSGMWRSRIMLNGKEIRLGHFRTELEAAKAYNKAALSLFKEFANLNKDENGNVL